MSEVPTHDYLCPCDMCEPEAHSVATYPALLGPPPEGLYDSLTDRYKGKGRKASAPTIAPPAQAEVAAFEELVRTVGEDKARWRLHLARLEERWGSK